MNQCILRGVVANEPKYGLVDGNMESILRAIMLVEDNSAAEQIAVPLVFYDWYAEQAKKLIKQGMRILVHGQIDGRMYEDEVGAKHYQHFLVVTEFSVAEITVKGDKTATLRPEIDKRFPLDVSDFEDMISIVN